MASVYITWQATRIYYMLIWNIDEVHYSDEFLSRIDKLRWLLCSSVGSLQGVSLESLISVVEIAKKDPVV